MSKSGIDDPESGTYEDDARALERELAAVVRRVLAEELTKPDFRRQLQDAVAPAIREVVEQQKKALRDEGEGLRRALGGGERGPIPAARASSRGEFASKRREEGSRIPQTFRDWIPWLLGGCLVLVVAGGAWFGLGKYRAGSSAEPRSEPRKASTEAASGNANDRAGSETAASGGDPGALDAIWLREIRAADEALPAGSPLLVTSVQTQLDCFFPDSTRDRLARRAGQLDGDLAEDFDGCVRQGYKLDPKAPSVPNAAVFAAQALARRLLVSKGRSGLTWCSSTDLGEVQPSRFKPDGFIGPTSFKVLNAVLPCLGIDGVTFDAKSPAEAYLAFSYAALGEIARLASEG